MQETEILLAKGALRQTTELVQVKGRQRYPGTLLQDLSTLWIIPHLVPEDLQGTMSCGLP